MALPGQDVGPVTQAGTDIDGADYWELYIEQYGGEVEGTLYRESLMAGQIAVKPVRGTDTISNNRVGKSTLQAVGAGVRPLTHQNQFGKVSVTVDTVILARANVFELDDLQIHFPARQEIGMEHGKEQARFFDEAMLIQGIKAASVTGTVGTGSSSDDVPEGWSYGTIVNLTTAGDELDPDKFLRGVEDTMQTMEENDLSMDGFVLYVKPAQYYALLRNDRLINSDYSLGNGNRAEGQVIKANGLPIVKTNRMPSAGVFPGDIATTPSHLLSNTRNGSAYDVTEAESYTVGLLMHSKTLLAGETIPLTSKVYFHDVEMMWFIDAYRAFGVAPNRPDHSGVIRAAYTPE